MRTVAVIPARYHSTRLPGKPLLKINGKTMLQIVWENAVATKSINSVIIATDHDLIFKEAIKFGAFVKMTSSGCSNGTERVIEAIKGVTCDAVFNIQCDEPLIDSDVYDIILNAHFRHEAPITTGRVRINNEHDINDPNCVKVVTDMDDNALYFSRTPIPFGNKIVYAHLGIYMYDKSFLYEAKDMSKTRLSEAESLEQLKFMEYGHKIKVVEILPKQELRSVDTIHDFNLVKNIMETEL